MPPCVEEQQRLASVTRETRASLGSSPRPSYRGRPLGGQGQRQKSVASLLSSSRWFGRDRFVFRDGHFRAGFTNMRCSPPSPSSSSQSAHTEKSRGQKTKRTRWGAGGNAELEECHFLFTTIRQCPPPPFPGAVSAPPGHVGRADTSLKSRPHIPNVHHRHKSTS